MTSDADGGVWMIGLEVLKDIEHAERCWGELTDVERLNRGLNMWCCRHVRLLRCTGS